MARRPAYQVHRYVGLSQMTARRVSHPVEGTNITVRMIPTPLQLLREVTALQAFLGS